MISPTNQKPSSPWRRRLASSWSTPLTERHNILAKTGDYRATEDLVLKALRDVLFSGWLSQQQPRPEWSVKKSAIFSWFL